MYAALNRDTVKHWCKARFIVFKDYNYEEDENDFILEYWDNVSSSNTTLLWYCLQYKETERSVYITADDGYCIIDKEQISYRIYKSLDEMEENERSVFADDKGFKGFAFDLYNLIDQIFG